MSESAAKATRRQLRRAVGDVVSAALTEQSQLVARHDRLLSAHSLQLDSLRADLAALKALVKP